MAVKFALDDAAPNHPDGLPPAPAAIGHLPFSTKTNYRAQWRAFAVRQYLALFLLFAWPAVAVGLFCWSRFSIHQPVACLAAMLLWLAAALAAVWWAGEFRCPRCRRRYGSLGAKKGSTNLTRGLFDQVCNNCKLRKFEDAG